MDEMHQLRRRVERLEDELDRALRIVTEMLELMESMNATQAKVLRRRHFDRAVRRGGSGEH